MRRVVVTGLGVVAPNGIGKEAFWSACLNGRSGIRRISSFDASSHPVQVAGEVCDFDALSYLPPSQRKNAKLLSRAMGFAVGASVLSVRDSGLELEREDPERVGVVMGTGIVPFELPEVAPQAWRGCCLSAVDPEVSAEHGGSSRLPRSQCPGTE
jgi:3-oxoacyl-[acyl-carrier-protein] synthase II